MGRAALEVADIFRTHGPAWRAQQAGHLSLTQLKIMSAIEQCRTSALGGHALRCDACDHVEVSYNSCRNRHCPKCQARAAQRWLEARMADLLPVRVLSRLFRRRFMEELEKLHRTGQLRFFGEHTGLADPAALAHLRLPLLWRHHACRRGLLPAQANYSGTTMTILGGFTHGAVSSWSSADGIPAPRHGRCHRAPKQPYRSQAHPAFVRQTMIPVGDSGLAGWWHHQPVPFSATRAGFKSP